METDRLILDNFARHDPLEFRKPVLHEMQLGPGRLVDPDQNEETLTVSGNVVGATGRVDKPGNIEHQPGNTDREFRFKPDLAGVPSVAVAIKQFVATTTPNWLESTIG